MLKIFSPFDQKLIKEIPFSTEKEVENALSTAHALFNTRSAWLAPHQRISILEKAAEIMKGRVDDLTKIATEEGGKPWTDSRVEVLRAINGVNIAKEHIGQLKGEQVPMGLTPSSENYLGFVTREPIGVVASISAFNHPLNLIVHQVVTAVAAGCPVIIKPSLTTPLSCIALVDILKEAGLPDNWCQVVITENELSEKLVTDPRVNYFSFIGSARVGWYLRSKLANGTRCALEHGGAAAAIVEKDANFKKTIPAILKGGFYHAGQVCVSVQRVFVHADIFDNFSREIAEGAKKLIVGDPMDKDTQVGPLILPREIDRVEQWVNEALEAGATLLSGGKRISDTCFEPTVLLNPPKDVRVSREEIFGPVVCIYSYDNRDQAIQQANELDVHFQAAVFTENLDIAIDTVQKLKGTAVMVNDHSAFRVDWMPFGGQNSSGIGIGGIPYSMHEMTQAKLMVIKNHQLL